MKHYIEIRCRYCNSDDLSKNGKSENGTQRYRCKSCKRTFQLDYSYNAWKDGVKEKIDTLILNSGGVRDTARSLSISKDTVVSHLKKKAPKKINPFYLDKVESKSLENLSIEVKYSLEGDEFWSFVGNKKNQRWTWYVIERETGAILCHYNGRRTDESCKQLIDMILNNFPVKHIYTDNWQSYSKYIPEEMHKVGKSDTWKIERLNLNFRTHLKRLSRKTICFSKSTLVHDNVIGMYINRFYQKNNTYKDTG